MIGRIRAVTLYVEDQDRSVQFFVEKLGFEKRTDSEMWPGARWIEVAPPGAETPFVIAAASDFDQVVTGGPAPMTLIATDVRELYEDLKAKNVDVTEPVEEEWSTFIKFTDPDGHEFLVGEA